MTPLKRPKYAKIKLSDIPEEVIKEYNLHQYATPDGWVYIKVSRGMYGLPQAGSFSHDLLEQRLNKEGYFQSQIVPADSANKHRKLYLAVIMTSRQTMLSSHLHSVARACQTLSVALA